tara:strand:+ start:5878 stop:6348 length:471 start_codon:yes stop_codon:yes gene_type:complete
MKKFNQYDPAMNDTVKRFCLLGYTDEQVAKALGVTRSAISKWKVKHPAFKLAMLEGKEFADAKVAESLYNRCLEGDVKAIGMWLPARQKQIWAKTKEVNITGQIDLSQKTLEELKEILDEDESVISPDMDGLEYIQDAIFDEIEDDDEMDDDEDGE